MIAKTALAEQNEFMVVGIWVRTVNEGGQSLKDIGRLFDTFVSGKMTQQISDRASDDIYCVYTDYETDHTSKYTAILGCKVEAVKQLSDGFVAVTIPVGAYRHYTIKGPLSESVGNAWMQIWETASARKFTADYDVYGVKSQDPEDPEMDIYVAI